MDFRKLTASSPIDTINIKYAHQFAKREAQEVSCGFDFKDSLGHDQFVDSIEQFHTEVLAALETEGFQDINLTTSELLRSVLKLHQVHARTIHQTTDDNIRLIVNYGLNWVDNGVINDPSSPNHGLTKQFPILVLNLATVYVDGPEGKNHVQTFAVMDIPLQRNVYIRAGQEYTDIDDEDAGS